MLARHLRRVVMVLKAAQDSDINLHLQDRGTRAGAMPMALKETQKGTQECWTDVRLKERGTCAGAMVMESPVWTPMGSTFSMEQMMTTLSARSRITSSSYSFQPSSDFSISTCARCRATHASPSPAQGDSP